MLIGVCASFALKEWNQQDTASSIKEDDNNLEIRIENVHQQECTGRVLVVHVTMDEEEDISAKMINECNENELGIKFVSFRWTSAKGITNAIRMNYCNKDDLRFEVLIGKIINDTIEHDCELVSVKETLKNVEVNQRIFFVGIEQ